VKIRVLPAALEDLERGRRFYARQGKSLGEYFLDSLFADINSLELHAGVPCSIAGANRGRLRRSCDDLRDSHTSLPPSCDV
jgi:hypothetical protein